MFKSAATGEGGHDDLSKCKQIAEAVRGRPTETQADAHEGTEK